MDKMQVTFAQYVTDPISGNNSAIKATIDGQHIIIPLNDMGNRHTAEIMRQVEAGSLTIQPAE